MTAYAAKSHLYRLRHPTRYLEQGAKWRRNNPVKRNAIARATNLKKKYGITIAQYDKMFALQGGVCAICHHPPKSVRLAVEHDHKTKRVRGLSCHHCNRHRIGTNTPETAKRVLNHVSSDFDGRSL